MILGQCNGSLIFLVVSLEGRWVKDGDVPVRLIPAADVRLHLIALCGGWRDLILFDGHGIILLDRALLFLMDWHHLNLMRFIVVSLPRTVALHNDALISNSIHLILFLRVSERSDVRFWHHCRCGLLLLVVFNQAFVGRWTVISHEVTTLRRHILHNNGRWEGNW